MRKKLCLLWQNRESRSWYHVADLTMRSSNSYIFEYTKAESEKSLDAALESGYRMHPAFPDRNKKYESSFLFSTFSRRLPSINREDQKLFFENIDKDNNEGNIEFQLLSETGGVLRSDNYEFVNPLEFNNNKINLDFYLRGWRHNNSSSDFLDSKKDKLILNSEPSNVYDSFAVEIYKNSIEPNNRIGYIPAFYSEFFTDVLNEGIEYNIKFEFNLEMPSRYKVVLNVTGIIPQYMIDKYDESMNVITCN
ncbi:hypothetical protein OL233_01555 [Vagococcus sp. PNs007]|uniref:HIRAN domain-containing protein n=1 Tax=Vagococcus proximus TaxID=2991417 RepID=A0ABT5WZ12_9ENTE|nr:HIRAN domain-containing protein [Vagococcus proximus]MDF0478959.1 hypothetical protein [Vagococcus proximus]